MRKYATYCGLYCGACIGLILHEKEAGDQSVQHLDKDEEDTPCGGCRLPEMAKCEIIECNLAHGTECCAFCNEYPCAMIISFKDEWEHHHDVLDNLDRIKEVGVEKWLEEQRKFWQCGKCGSRTKWYQKICTVCNETIV